VIALLFALAHAGELHVVGSGETVESIAARLGDATLAQAIRARNGLAPGAQPKVGDALQLPDVPSGTDQPAEVLAFQGVGTLRGTDGRTFPLVVGALLPPGAEVCTGDESFATLRLASTPGCGDEDDMTLLPRTCVTIAGNHAAPGRRSSVVDVRSGSVTVRDGAQRGLVVVRTPSGATRGAQGGFRVAVEAAAMRAEAVSRGVDVQGAGVERPLAAGYGARTPSGAAPGDPVALLPAPGPTAPAPDARLDVPDFAWTTVDRALGYRVELAIDPDFSQLVRRAEVARPAWEPTTLFLPYRVPSLYWRVVGFDRLGFEGIPSQGRRARFPIGIDGARAP
jgi:hypothetical protein